MSLISVGAKMRFVISDEDNAKKWSATECTPLVIMFNLERV